jgi:hypothetical protein
MMTLPKKCIAINSLRGWLLALCVAPALAGTAIGTVTQVNGPLLLQRADGSIKAITLNSFVEQGDTLVTEKNTYAQLKFADHSEVTLKPNTQLKIEALVDTAGAANSLDTVFSMRTGAIQIKTGAAARAKPESIKLVMPNLRDHSRWTARPAPPLLWNLLKDRRHPNWPPVTPPCNWQQRGQATAPMRLRFTWPKAGMRNSWRS